MRSLALLAALFLAAPRQEVWDGSVLVVDRATGEGVFRASVRAVEERATPLPGEAWWTVRSTTDAAGRASFDPDDVEGLSLWWLVDAPGFAPFAVHRNPPPRRIELTPGLDVRLTVLDALGRRAPSVRVGWMLGCGHVPDSRVGVTDARGEVSLPDVDPESAAELWVSGPGVLADHPAVEWSEDRRSATVRCGVGVTQRGRVVDVEGNAVEGVYVGQPNRHRGPWSRTNGDGGFELFGATDDELWLRDAAGSDLGFVPPATELAPRRIVLGEEDEPYLATLEVVVRGADGPLLPELPVRVVRASDGWNTRVRPGEDGSTAVSVPLGRYLLRVGGGLTDFEPARAEVRLRRPEGARVELDLVRRPTFALAEPGPPEGARLHLISPTEVRDVTDRWDRLPVPDGACALHLQQHGAVRTRLLDPGEARPGAVLELSELLDRDQ